METINHLFRELYKNLSDGDIESILSQITDNVRWANVMEGGYVYGHRGVKEYLTRQFTMMRSHVTPLKISIDFETVRIKVHQVVRDLEGKLLADELIYHYFYLRNAKIADFTIGEEIPN